MKAWTDLKTHWRSDLTAGFILSLIALPLCIGIAGASIGNGSLSPAVSGFIAAVVGADYSFRGFRVATSQSTGRQPASS